MLASSSARGPCVVLPLPTPWPTLCFRVGNDRVADPFLLASREPGKGQSVVPATRAKYSHSKIRGEPPEAVQHRLDPMTIQQNPAWTDRTIVPAAVARNDCVIETSIPSRLDALRWSGFHTRVVVALGVTWILDGLEVTLAGALSGALKESPTLQFSNVDVGLANSAYLAGAVVGAIGFGWLTDRIGRRKLFFVTLALYLAATAATALSWNVASYALFRFLTGAGIGGEYTAINSTIQELVPARYRGWTDLVINGSFWVGAAWDRGCSASSLTPVHVQVCSAAICSVRR